MPKFNSNPAGTYFPGGDWLLLEVEPATYVKGSGGAGIPSFPKTWAEWDTGGFFVPVGSLPNPVSTPLAVSAAGYSCDYYAASQTPSVHLACEIRRDGVCNSAHAGEGEGILVTSCESNPCASGGPVMTGWPLNPVLVGVIAGNGTVSSTCYSSDNLGNKLVNSNGFNTVPRNAGGG